MLTVRQLVDDLDGVRLVAGAQGLDVPVRWVHITELEDPTPWLSGGELLLTTGLQLGDESEQRRFVEKLADHQLAGLGLGTGFSHDSIPEAMREVAEERGLPLFEVPYEMPFIALTEKAFSRLVNEHYAVLQRSIAAHERLERIVLSEGGLDAVVAAVSALIGGPVVVYGARGEPLAERTFRRPLADDAVGYLGDELRRRTADGKRRGFVPDTSLSDDPGAEPAGGALALPVAATGTPDSSGAVPRAWLVGAKDAGGLSEFDRLVLHQAVTIVALELLRQRVAEDTEQRLAGDVLSGLARGDLTGPELVRRLEPFGLRGDVGAVVLAREDDSRRAVETLEPAVANALRAEAVSGLVAPADGFVCAIVSAGEDEGQLFALAERLRASASDAVGAPVRGGAGRAVPAGDARRAFHEARCALEARALAAAESNGTPGTATYRDLGSFQLLLSLQDDEALRLFCDSVLGPLDNGEGHYGDELLRSLEVFIECNGQWEKAARRLYCHRHTLRYRIRRVEELTGRSLSSARDRIEFWLALRGRELVPVRVALLGAGGTIGPAIARDLAESPEVGDLVLLDLDGARAREVAELHGAGRAQGAAIDAGDRQALTLALEGCTVLVNAASYRLNLHAMDACLAAGCSYIDLGGLYKMTERQLALGPAFEERGLLALLGAGAGPGKTNVMAARAAADLDTVEAVRCASAGLDLDPPPGLSTPYALRTLLDEITVPPVVVRGGQASEVEPLAEGGRIPFPEPVGERDSIYTLHSEVLTLPASLGASECDFRLSLGPGILDRLREIAAMPEEEAAALRPAPPSPNTHSAQHVLVRGTRGGEPAAVTVTAHTMPRPAWGLGGGVVSTASVAAASVRLLARGELKGAAMPGMPPAGALPPERVLDFDALAAELAPRGCTFQVREEQLV